MKLYIKYNNNSRNYTLTLQGYFNNFRNYTLTLMSRPIRVKKTQIKLNLNSWFNCFAGAARVIFPLLIFFLFFAPNGLKINFRHWKFSMYMGSPLDSIDTYKAKKKPCQVHPCLCHKWHYLVDIAHVITLFFSASRGLGPDPKVENSTLFF